MKTKIIVLCLIVILLLSSGCQQVTSKFIGGRETKEIPPLQQYRTGTEGITVDFFKDFPPSKILQGDPLTIMLNLENKGAHSVEKKDITLLLRSSEPEIKLTSRTSLENQILEEFGGKRTEMPNGDMVLVEYDAENNFVPRSAKETVTFDAKLCYNYKTILDENKFCLAPSGKTFSVSDICTLPQTYTYSSGQGAPVAITKLIEEIHPMAEGKVLLVIQIIISDLGKEGDKSSSGVREYEKDGFNENSCSKPVYSENKKINLKEVKFSEYSYSGKTISCDRPQLILTPITQQSALRTQEVEINRIICRVTMDEPSQAYTTPLYVELEYGYEMRKVKEVIVERTAYALEEEAIFCPEDRCFSSSLWGVGTGNVPKCHVYGGEDPTLKCRDETSKLCCQSSKTLCETTYGLKCQPYNNCPLKETYYENLCPGTDHCCKPAATTT